MKITSLTTFLLLCIRGGLLLFLIVTADSFLIRLSWLGVLILTGMAAWSLVKKKDPL